MYCSLSLGLRTHLGYPLASALSLRNVFIYKQTTVTRARVVLRNLVFVDFENVVEILTLLDG